MRKICAALFLLMSLSAAAAEWPRVEAIRYVGNEVTREQVLAHELTIAVGAPADPIELERSRQAVLDLGLFREVNVLTAPGKANGVVVTVQVREKRFLLVLPRIDTSSDKEVSYGAQLRWSNVGGRNHRLSLTAAQGKFPNERRRERERELAIAYFAPRLGGSDWGTSLRAQHVERVTPADGGNYDETFDRFEALAVYDLTEGRPRRGWTVGGGLLLEKQRTDGELAPPPDGTAIALVGTAVFNNLRYHVHSETGRKFTARLQGAGADFGSDYGYGRFEANYFESRRWGQREHQTWHLLGGIAHRSGGPDSRNEFTLGGSGRLRGYESDFLEGDSSYYGSVEFLRPLGRDWLRGVAMIEVGGTDNDREGLRSGSPYADVALGVRIRLPWFVEVEVELGVAYPLRGDGGARFFAGGN